MSRFRLKKLFLSILLILWCNVSFSSEVINSFNNDNISVINDEIRQLNALLELIKSATGGVSIDLSSQVDSLLSLDNGGTGIDLSSGSQGDIIYFSADGSVGVLSIGSNGQVLVSNGTTFSWAAASNVTVYTSGSGNFTVPAGITKVYVTMIGGGGGGASGKNPDTTYGPGGAGASAIINVPYTVTPGGTVAYAVGSGGAGGSGSGIGAGGNNGATGGNTTFGTLTAEGAAGGAATTGGAKNSTTMDAVLNVAGSFGKFHGGNGGNSDATHSGGGGGTYFGAGPAGRTSVGNGTAATANTGTGGAGGAGTSGAGGNGGSGIIIISY